MKRNRWRKLASPNAGESDPDSDSDVVWDSGYNSQSDRESDPQSDTDAKAMYYQQKMNEFKEAGVTLSNPCDETKAMMEAELERWEM
jgi:hypothetical protein